MLFDWGYNMAIIQSIQIPAIKAWFGSKEQKSYFPNGTSRSLVMKMKVVKYLTIMRYAKGQEVRRFGLGEKSKKTTF